MKLTCKLTLRKLIGALYWSPVIILAAVIGWSIVALMRSVFPLLKFKSLILVYLLLFILMSSLYYKTIMTPPGSPKTLLDSVEHGLLENQEFISVEIKRNGRPRFCTKCNAVKPDRAHHCSSCSQCVLKMDHHCPWMNNCLGFDNYKYFFQFLIVAFLYSLAIFIVTLNLVWTKESIILLTNFELLVLIIVSASFSFSLLIFGGFHVFLVFSNLTTIEYMEGSTRLHPALRFNKNAYDIGWRRNVCSVLGSNWREWVFPIPASREVRGNGWAFPVNGEILEKLKIPKDNIY